MSYTPRYDKGNWKADCDVCGRTYKSSELQKRWDGLMCCRHDWEIRQPQDFVRGVADTQIAPWTRPEPADQFVPIAYWMTITANPVLTLASMTETFVQGPSLEKVTISNTVTLNYVRRFPITGGARQINGSSINNTTLG